MSNKKDDVFLTDTNWDQYVKYRPPYPRSLEKLVMEFHRAHSNSFRLAHDVGSGNGVFAIKLAEYFQHVHVSDIKPSSVAGAREHVDAWFQQNWWKARFSFSVTAAEEADEPFVSGSVDCVTLMQCAHWTDQEVMVRKAARSLTPNGTLAVVSINPAPRVVGNDQIAAAVRQLFEFWGRSVIDERGGDEGVMAKEYVSQGNSGVESIPLPEDMFIQDVTKRIEINALDSDEAPHAIPGLEQLVKPSRADSSHRRYAYTFEDEQADGWRYEVDSSWFRGLIATMDSRERLYKYEGHLRRVEELVQTLAPAGKIVVEWTVAILFATRK